MMRLSSRSAFTLLEICLAMMIMVLMMAVAIPAFSGVFSQRGGEESFREFDACVEEARSRSWEEGRPYVVRVTQEGVEVQVDGGAEEPVARFEVEKGEKLAMEFPAAIRPPAESVWTFWPNGVCEPVIARYTSAEGAWTARYNPLTGRAEVEYE